MSLSSEPGRTCCHDDDLLNDTVDLGSRIDMVFHTNDLTPITSTVNGNQPTDRTPAGHWPSDHAGVVATFTIP